MTDQRLRTDHDPDELVTAYALGVLDPEEARELEAHLGGCAACRAALARYEQVVGEIGAAVEPVSPRPELRETLLAELDHGEEPPVAPVPLHRRGWVIALGIAAAVALVVIATLGVLLARTMDERDAARYAEQRIVEYLREGGTLSALVPAGDAPADVAAGHGALAIVPDGSQAMLVVYDLPASGEDRQYMAWAERDGERERLGELPVDDDGVGWLRFYPDEPMSSYERVGITRFTPDAPNGESFLVAPVD